MTLMVPSDTTLEMAALSTPWDRVQVLERCGDGSRLERHPSLACRLALDRLFRRSRRSNRLGYALFGRCWDNERLSR